MNIENFFTTLSSFCSLSDSFRESLAKAVIPLSLPRNYVLLEATKVAGCLYYIEEGLAMEYTFMKGRKQVEWFWRSGEILVSVRSFFEQIPAHEFIQVRTDCELFCITHAGFLDLFETHREAQIIYRSIMSQYIEHSRDRLRDMQSLTALSRYEKLIHRFPGIEQHVTQEDIASYLGVAPQSFSRIKRKQRRR